jgi:hypothetical protein
LNPWLLALVDAASHALPVAHDLRVNTMPGVSIKVKIEGLGPLNKRLSEFATPSSVQRAADQAARVAALVVLDASVQRIFFRGDNSRNAPIGTYSLAYLKRRQARFGASRRVVLRFTEQMWRDYQVVRTSTGYGLGFNNRFNFQKSVWNEERYGKIFDLTRQERKLVQVTAERQFFARRPR